MVDYDVMVFVRCEDKNPLWKPNWTYIANICESILWRNETSALLIMSYDEYLGTRSAAINHNMRYITEIQLIKPRSATITYHGNVYEGTHCLK